MPTNDYSKNIVYLSKEQYQELITNETLTVNGQTITYNDNDIYVTPQAEPITDVRISGTSLTASNGSVNIFNLSSLYGLEKTFNGYLHVTAANEAYIKESRTYGEVINPSNQHYSVFYGLSKAAGADLSGATVTFGTYPDSSKAAIQNMLGITDLMSTEESSTATAAHALNSTFMMDGKLHRATTAIAVGDAVTEGENCEVVKADEVFVKKTDIAGPNNVGVVKTDITKGIGAEATGRLYIYDASIGGIKAGDGAYASITPRRQHYSVFYGLSKVAGVDLANEEVTFGTYPETSKTAIRTLIGAAAASDIPSIPVQDVQIDSVSILNQGIANIPLAGPTNFGVVKMNTLLGIEMKTSGTYSGYAAIFKALDTEIKQGRENYRPIVPSIQHQSVFYGLAKAAGDTTQSISTNAVGTYTSEAKAAIQSMLDVPSKADVANLIAVSTTAPSESEAKIWIDTDDSTTVQVPTVSEMNLALAAKVGDVQVNGSSVVSNNIANIPLASANTDGVAKIGAWGLYMRTEAGVTRAAVDIATSPAIRDGNSGWNPIAPNKQHEAVFYGLAKAAGDATQSVSTNAVGTYTDEAKSAIQTMLGVPSDVQVNGTSVISNGVANIPACTTSTYGVVKPHTNSFTFYDGALRPRFSSVSDVKGGNDAWKPLHADLQHAIAFYGLARAAGDATQSASSNTVGTYTAEAKAAIQTMLGIDLASIAAQVDIPLVETVTGTTPSITGQPNVRYVCGEVSTITLTPPASGSMDVIFESGSTAAVLTVPNTVKWPAWFDASSLETDITYEILITDGVYGSVMTWAT